MTEDPLRPAGARIVETVDLAPTDRTALLNRAYDEVLQPSFPDNELIEREELIGACSRLPEARPVAVACLSITGARSPPSCLTRRIGPPERSLSRHWIEWLRPSPQSNVMRTQLDTTPGGF